MLVGHDGENIMDLYVASGSDGVPKGVEYHSLVRRGSQIGLSLLRCFEGNQR